MSELRNAMHERAALLAASLRHSPEFWEVANRYPLTERALGFLIAKQVTDNDVAEEPA